MIANDASITQLLIEAGEAFTYELLARMAVKILQEIKLRAL